MALNLSNSSNLEQLALKRLAICVFIARLYSPRLNTMPINPTDSKLFQERPVFLFLLPIFSYNIFVTFSATKACREL